MLHGGARQAGRQILRWFSDGVGIDSVITAAVGEMIFPRDGYFDLAESAVVLAICRCVRQRLIIRTLLGRASDGARNSIGIVKGFPSRIGCQLVHSGPFAGLSSADLFALITHDCDRQGN